MKRENSKPYPLQGIEYDPRHDKTNKVTVRPAKTQISLGIRPVWSESSLSAWRKLGSLATHWVHSENSDQTGRMPRLIWVFAGCTLILLVLSGRGSDHLTSARSFHISYVQYFMYLSLGEPRWQNIRIFNGCEMQIENSVTRVTVRPRNSRGLPSDAEQLSWVTEFSLRTEQPF